jgi:hypothetical protein
VPITRNLASALLLLRKWWPFSAPAGKAAHSPTCRTVSPKSVNRVIPVNVVKEKVYDPFSLFALFKCLLLFADPVSEQIAIRKNN